MEFIQNDKLNGCVDPDSLNKAVDLFFGLALGNKDNCNRATHVNERNLLIMVKLGQRCVWIRGPPPGHFP